MRALIFAVALAGCTSGGGTAEDDVIVPDASGLSCDPADTFSAPTAVAGLDTTADELGARFSADEQTVWFHRGTGAEDHDLFEATRSSSSGAFGTATAITNLNTGSAHERSASVTSDGLTMVFSSDRGGTFDLFLADRDTLGGQFAVVSQIVGTNTGFAETGAFLASDGSELFFSSTRDGDADVYRAAPSGNSFGSVTLVTELSTAGVEDDVVLSDDGTTIYFARDGAIFRASRTGAGAAFSGVEEVTELGDGSPLWLSADGCRMYLTSDRGGDFDVFVAERTPA